VVAKYKQRAQQATNQLPGVATVATLNTPDRCSIFSPEATHTAANTKGTHHKIHKRCKHRTTADTHPQREQ
jgi:hypothetical protein